MFDNILLESLCLGEQFWPLLSWAVVLKIVPDICANKTLGLFRIFELAQFNLLKKQTPTVSDMFTLGSIRLVCEPATMHQFIEGEFVDRDYIWF